MSSYMIEIPITGTRVVTIEANSKEEAMKKLSTDGEAFVDIFDNIDDFDINAKDVKISEYDQAYFDENYGDDSKINY